MHESHIHSFLAHFPFICYNNTNFGPVLISRANGFTTLPPLTLTSFKAMDVTLKYTWFLKIGNVAMYQETDLVMKVIMKCVNVNLWDRLGCFHYILNAPRIMQYVKKMQYRYGISIRSFCDHS